MFIKLENNTKRNCVICGSSRAEYLAISDPGRKIMILSDGELTPCNPTPWCKNCASKYFPEKLPVNQ